MAPLMEAVWGKDEGDPRTEVTPIQQVNSWRVSARVGLTPYMSPALADGRYAHLEMPADSVRSVGGSGS